MTFILNEHEWAHDMIESHSLGKHPVETLTRVARYYMDEGYTGDSLRRELELFLVQSKPDAVPALWMDTLDKVITLAGKRPAVAIDRIIVTDAELEFIERLTGVQTKRLAFTLLCLAKYYDALNPDANHWVCTDDQDIMAMANIKTSIRRQSAMYRQMRDAGLLRFSKKVDNTSVCVLFVTNGNPVMSITDFRNLGNQYMMYTGASGYYRCDNCGIIVHAKRGSDHGVNRKGVNKKYCQQCKEMITAAIKAKWYPSRKAEKIKSPT